MRLWLIVCEREHDAVESGECVYLIVRVTFIVTGRRKFQECYSVHGNATQASCRHLKRETWHLLWVVSGESLLYLSYRAIEAKYCASDERNPRNFRTIRINHREFYTIRWVVQKFSKQSSIDLIVNYLVNDVQIYFRVSNWTTTCWIGSTSFIIPLTTPKYSSHPSFHRLF